MSRGFDTDGYAEVHTTTTRRARKAHRCTACERIIPIGTQYTYVFNVTNGDIFITKRCELCQRIYAHLDARMRKEARDTFPDADLDCGDSYRDVWGEDPPEHIQALAFGIILPEPDPRSG